MAQEVVFRQLFCRGSGCGVMFYICGSCYRGQVYCGDRVPRPDETPTEAARQPPLPAGPGGSGRSLPAPAEIPGPVPPPARDRSYFRRSCSIRQHQRALGGNGNQPVRGWRGFHDRPRLERLQAALRPVCIVCGRVCAQKIDRPGEGETMIQEKGRDTARNTPSVDNRG